MISLIGGNNSIQMINALNAFKANREISNESSIKKEIDTPNGINFKDSDKILNKVDLADVRNYAKQIGENISDEDIKYGLTYGRSVIANYIA